jgi:hypothetical protein
MAGCRGNIDCEHLFGGRWLHRMVRPLHSSLHGFKSRAGAASKCVNALLQDVSARIDFGDLKCDRGSVLGLGRRMNDLAVAASLG